MNDRATTHLVPPPGAHGGDAPALARALGIPVDDVVDLSVSTNPCAPDIVELVRRHATAVRRYPDARAATAALATVLAVPPDRVVLTNGGAEAIALAARVHPSGAVDAPEFSLYERHLARVADSAPPWRSNPNNPTGRLAGADVRAAVWDEAFYPLATGTWTRGDADRGALVVGSLTKVFACPGLRIGYVLAPDADAAARIARMQPEWSVGAVACAVVPSLLATAVIREWANGIAQLRAALVATLIEHGATPEPSDANFVLVRRARGLRDHLGARGVLVRDTASFGIPDGVRIAVPDESGLARLRAALPGWSP